MKLGEFNERGINAGRKKTPEQSDADKRQKKEQKMLAYENGTSNSDFKRTQSNAGSLRHFLIVPAPYLNLELKEDRRHGCRHETRAMGRRDQTRNRFLFPRSQGNQGASHLPCQQQIVSCQEARGSQATSMNIITD